MTDLHAELEVAQRYAANQLDAAAAAAFEDHLVACDRCQAEVRLMSGMRRVMRESTASTGRHMRGFTIGATLLAAAVAAVLIFPSGIDRELTDLGRIVDPPAYQAMGVRASTARGDSLFAAAMTSYNQRRYDAAASGLREALGAGVDSIPATFFLASSYLMTGQARDAAAAYARVVLAGVGASAYLEEAHLYRAHALLQLGRASEAQVDLDAVVRMDGAHRETASALAARVSRVTRR